MKYLSNYIEEELQKSIDDAGAFWAFNDKQFDKGKKEGVEYANMDAGLCCPKKNCISLEKELSKVLEKGIKKDIQENGIPAIIKRELLNHEISITGDIADTVRALAGYNVSKKDIMSVYNTLNIYA